jgi:hypothetical protein
VLAASMVAADTAQALGDRAAGTVAADTASQALADMAPGLLPLIQSEVAVSPAGATWVAGCSATAPLPTSLCDRNSGRRDSAVDSSDSAWPWWRGGLVLGWFGPLFWPYAHYDLFDYVYWPYAYDDFWPYAYDDVYYGIYGPYAYYGPYGASRASGRVSSARYGSTRYATTTNGSARRAAEVCSNQAPELTDWPIEGISEVVQPTDAQRPALEELRAASAKAIDMLRSGCPKDLPSIPTGRLAAMESRLQVMLAAVQTVRPALERFYQSLSDEQKARFNAIAPADDPNAAGKDRRDLAKFCDEKAPDGTDLPIDRIAQAVQPTPAQRAGLDELKNASAKAADGLNVNCPTYQTLTPTGRVEAMEKRLDATLGAVKTVGPALVKFYNSLSDEQKARFNSLRSASRPTG